MNRAHPVLKAREPQSLPALLLFLSLFAWTAHAQITPLGDAYTNTADPTTKYGAKTLLDVDGATQITYIQFNLASIPTTASVSQATLKLYVNAVTTAGSFNVDYVNGTWTESTIDASNAPALGTTIASDVSVTTADKNQYILVNVTSAVQAWLNGSETNNGLALVANSTFNATFDSKESTTTSHPPELDIAFAGGDGTLTGVTTASGSGLTGGGTSGTLNLSLTNGCTANQVLQWSGSAWACSSAGTGTITGVKAGTALTGGGTSGAVTVNLDTTKVPLLAAKNTFTGNQTVNGNLNATGMVAGSGFEIGSNLFDWGSYANANAFLGFAGNTGATGSYNTASGYAALQSITTGAEDTAIGYAALQGNTAAAFNTAVGYGVLQSNSGSFNTAIGVQAMGSNSTGYQDTAIGVAALLANTTGYYNAATGLDALRFNTTGYGNTASGYAALYSNTTICCNTAVGTQALANSNVSSTCLSPCANDAFGYQALYNNSTGVQNEAFGYQAGYSNAGGTENSAFGYQALYSNAGGCTGDPCQPYGVGNSAFGTGALYANNCGSSCSTSLLASFNVAFGGGALGNNTTGSENTAVGVSALSNNSTGSDLTCIGIACNASGDVSNATAIGAHALVEQSNSLVLGGTGHFAVNVGIGTTKPSNILTIGRGAGHPVSDSWETYSSRRWKTNIHPLENALGKVEQLRGVSYDLKDSGRHEIGVIAEEVGAVVPEVVTFEENGKDARGVDYSRLTALLIEATKEQQALIHRQQAQIQLQQAKIDRLSRQVSAVQAAVKASRRADAEIRAASAIAPATHQELPVSWK
jgi:hypothetical protein